MFVLAWTAGELESLLPLCPLCKTAVYRRAVDLDIWVEKIHHFDT